MPPHDIEGNSKAAIPRHPPIAYTTKPNLFLLHSRPVQYLAAHKPYSQGYGIRHLSDNDTLTADCYSFK
jgi:hypothetical protein